MKRILTIPELNAKFKDKSILIIGNHPMKGQTGKFVEMLESGDEKQMVIKLDLTNENVTLNHDNVFVIVKSMPQNPRYN